MPKSNPRPRTPLYPAEAPPPVRNGDGKRPGLYWSTTDDEGLLARIYWGDVLWNLRQMPGRSVHCVVTSPPYWGLRDYGTGEWQGGDPNCDHKAGSNYGSLNDKSNAGAIRGGPFRSKCGRCGATRVDDQIGLEETPAEYVQKMVEVFRELKRVLRRDGSVWLNLGDSYAGGSCGGGSVFSGGRRDGRNQTGVKFPEGTGTIPSREYLKRRDVKSGLPSGNLVGIPWRVAFALQDDGWILREDVIWSKKSPMPESVTNRCTRAHEYIFHLTLQEDYYHDRVAIMEEAVGNDPGNKSHKYVEAYENSEEGDESLRTKAGLMEIGPRGTRNKRSVWHIAGRPYPGAHFATFSPELIEPCILASSGEKGCCAKCGAPWRRVVEETQLRRERPNEYVKRDPRPKPHEKSQNTPGKRPYSDASTLRIGNTCANTVAGVELRTVGWEPSCCCHGRQIKRKVKVLKGLQRDRNAYEGLPDTMSPHGIRKLSGASHAKWRNGPHTEEDYKWKVIDGYSSDLPLDEHPVAPCVVLDPFLGSGTTVALALALGRAGWGIDLSEDYIRKIALPRITGVLLARPDLAHLTGQERKPILLGSAFRQ